MRLLPFDPFTPRALSLVLLGLIVLLTQATDPSRAGTSLIRNDGGGPSCGSGYVPSNTGWGCGGTRNSIRGGNLTVGTSF